MIISDKKGERGLDGFYVNYGSKGLLKGLSDQKVEITVIKMIEMIEMIEMN